MRTIGPEEQKLRDWIEKKRSQGMVSVHYTFDDTKFQDNEDACAVVNAFNDAIDSGNTKPLKGI
jgi:hypothetical protein